MRETCCDKMDLLKWRMAQVAKVFCPALSDVSTKARQHNTATRLERD